MRQREYLDRFYPVAKRVARNISRRTPPSVRAEDLESEAALKLIELFPNYTPDQAETFEGYLAISIRGHLLDRLRKRSPKTRRTIAIKRQADEARRDLTKRLSRAPTDPEIAQAIGVSLDVLQRIQKKSAMRVISGDAPIKGIESGTRLFERVQHKGGVDAVQVMTTREQQDQLRAAINRLPRAQRRVMRLSLYEKKSLREIGDSMGVTESRASQLRKNAIEEIRLGLKRRREAPDPVQANIMKRDAIKRRALIAAFGRDPFMANQEARDAAFDIARQKRFGAALKFTDADIDSARRRLGISRIGSKSSIDWPVYRRACAQCGVAPYSGGEAREAPLKKEAGAPPGAPSPSRRRRRRGSPRRPRNLGAILLPENLRDSIAKIRESGSLGKTNEEIIERLITRGLEGLASDDVIASRDSYSSASSAGEAT